MKATRKIISQANQIAAKYSKWIEPKELQQMYKELEAIGVTTGLVHNDNKSCEWYLNGEEVENSLFVYITFSDSNVSEHKKEYTIYFS